MNAKFCFLGNLRKNIPKCRLLKILPRVLSVSQPAIIHFTQVESDLHRSPATVRYDIHNQGSVGVDGGS